MASGRQTLTAGRPTAGLLVAAPRSGSGKTVLTLGLMRLFARAGARVAGLKNGPDYIDPAFHAAATGRPSLNLDSWAMPGALLDRLAAEAAADADMVIAEGSMGLFDGVAAPAGETGASADLAARLGLPVLLVLDVSGQSQTAAAVALGCDKLRADVRVGGVVLNRVASERHRRLASEALAAIGLPVVGALPRAQALALPERHLGLVQAGELPRLEATLDAVADFVAAHVDLDAVRGMARPLGLGPLVPDETPPNLVPPILVPPGQRIAVARDAAFTFLYPHLARGWRAAGAELSFFSPLADEPPPDDCDCCWLPGGYPELHAGALAAAGKAMAGLRRFADTRPVHGECGGYMAMGQSLTDAEGREHAMAGLLGASFSFAVRRMTLGYREVVLAADGCLGARGTRLRGHEFHYATMREGDDEPLGEAVDATGASKPSGGRRGNASGSFFHLIAAR